MSRQAYAVCQLARLAVHQNHVRWPVMPEPNGNEVRGAQSAKKRALGSLWTGFNQIDGEAS